VLDMYSGPCWEQLHEGLANVMWLKQVSRGCKTKLHPKEQAASC
jgi:hypothetical protein